MGTLPGLQEVEHGLQCKAEGQETLTVRLPTSAGQPRLMHMRAAVCLQIQTNGYNGYIKSIILLLLSAGLLLKYYCYYRPSIKIFLLLNYKHKVLLLQCKVVIVIKIVLFLSTGCAGSWLL